MKETTVEAISVNYGTFTKVKQLRDELNRVLSDNHDKDIPLEPPINATERQHGSRFVSVTLQAGIAGK
jgi:hypothetical protein